jgi:hypothetical protein
MTLFNPTNVTVTGTTTTTTTILTSSVASTTASQILMGGNSKRTALTIFNDSTANLYVDLGKAPTLTDYAVKIAGGGYYELPCNYTGTINGLWDAANGNARVRDFATT